MLMGRWFATVRVRTTVFATLVVTAALVAGAILLLVVQQRALVAGLERNARNRATDVAALAKRGALPVTLTAAKEDAAFTQVIGPNGNGLAASKNLRTEGRVLANVPSRSKVLVMSRSLTAFDGDRVVSAETLLREALDDAHDHLRDLRRMVRAAMPPAHDG